MPRTKTLTIKAIWVMSADDVVTPAWDEAVKAAIHEEIPKEVRDGWASLPPNLVAEFDVDSALELIQTQIEETLTPAREEKFGAGAPQFSVSMNGLTGCRYEYPNTTMVCHYSFAAMLGGEPWVVPNPDDPDQVAEIAFAAELTAPL